MRRLQRIVRVARGSARRLCSTTTSSRRSGSTTSSATARIAAACLRSVGGQSFRNETCSNSRDAGRHLQHVGARSIDFDFVDSAAGLVTLGPLAHAHLDGRELQVRPGLPPSAPFLSPPPPLLAAAVPRLLLRTACGAAQCASRGRVLSMSSGPPRFGRCPARLPLESMDAPARAMPRYAR